MGTTLPSNLAVPTDIRAYNSMFFAITGVGQLLAPVLGGVVIALSSSPLAVWGILVVASIPAAAILALYVAPRLSPEANRA